MKNTTRIPFNVPYVSGKELTYIQQVIESKNFAGNGPFTKKVHAFLSARYGVKNVLLTHSCTAALELSALLLDLGPEDEVILPSYTFSSTASSFLRTGAKLVFCEIDPKTYNLDAGDACARITSKTKVIVPVHYGGIGANMEPLIQAAQEKGIALVEDAAQGLDAKLHGRWLGTIAPLGAFSFHETKNLHCGLGGALFIRDQEQFERAEMIWERGTNRSKVLKGLIDKYSWVELGSSFYPSELQAAFLLAQLESIESNLQQRKRVYEQYHSELSSLVKKGHLSFPEIGREHTLNYHSFFIIFRSIQECDAVRMHLHKENIQAYIGYVPLHSSVMGKKLGYRAEDLPVTEEYAQRVLRLPFHHELSREAIGRICDEIRHYFESKL